jgi:hypothetical protein
MVHKINKGVLRSLADLFYVGTVEFELLKELQQNILNNLKVSGQDFNKVFEHFVNCMEYSSYSILWNGFYCGLTCLKICSA